VKGLPSGYNRDQQEDRRALLAAGPRAQGAIHAMTLALPHVAFDVERGRAALADGSTQATDLAEALVVRGVPFRTAYSSVGALVRAASDAGLALARFCEDLERARKVAPAIDADALAVLDPEHAVRAKESPGGTGPHAVAAQIEALRARADALVTDGYEPEDLAKGIANEPLEAP
jgi:argininosuccinate lyase